MADTNDKGNGKEYESKLEEARRELSGSFSSPRAKTADESAVHAIQKDEVLSNLSDDELAEKKREAQMALGGAPRQKKRVYSKLEREALARAQDVSRIMKAREEEHERSRTAPPPTNLPGTHVAPPKVTPDQVHFKKQVTKPSYATRFVASVKDSDIDALLNETKGEKNKDVEQAPVVKPAQTNPLPQLKKQTDHEKLSEEITKEKQSLVQLAIEEQKRRAALSQSGYYEKAQRRQTVIIIAAIVFALLGTGLIIYNVFLTRPEVEIPTGPEAQEYLVTPNTVRSLSLSPLLTAPDRFQSLVTEVTLDPGSIQAIRVTQEEGTGIVAPVNETLSGLSIDIPEELARTLGSDYMVGAYGDISNYAFLVLQVDSFSQAFSSILSWEREGLAGLYNVLTGSTINVEARGTSWKDVYIRNIDARVLENRSGDIFLVYSFIDKNTLVIAPSVNTFLEIVDRTRTPEQILR